MKILVVDDEALLVKGIRFNLQNDGYDVITGSNGLDAVELARDPSVDLIVLDVDLKGLDGFELIRFLRCRGEYPPGETRKWETILEIIARTKPVLDKYAALGYEKIAVVAHGGVIRRYTGVGLIAHGEVCEIEYTPDFAPFGWI